MTIMTLLEFAGMDRQAYDRLAQACRRKARPQASSSIPAARFRMAGASSTPGGRRRTSITSLMKPCCPRPEAWHPAPARREHFHAYHAGMVAPGAC